jgi:predicted short-subunit dehydrogenase-like oxidoreductase (DUF2520 family)
MNVALMPGPQDLVDQSDLVFVIVSDDAIADLAASLNWRPGMKVVHCSGALDRRVLQSAAASGSEVGSFHPLQSFTEDSGAASFRGISIAIEADPIMAEALVKLARSLGATPVTLQEGTKPLYHAAAVLVSNYLVTLAGAATVLLGECGLSQAQALSALLPLMRGSAENLERAGMPHALTGPISRGDISTVERHLLALEQHRPEYLAAYAELGRLTLSFAREREHFNADQVGEMDRRLSQRINQEGRASCA